VLLVGWGRWRLEAADGTIIGEVEQVDRTSRSKPDLKAIAAKIPAIFLGTRVDTGVVGKNVMAPIVTGRGGFGRIDKWQVS
jgi:hypothetical protein